MSKKNTTVAVKPGTPAATEVVAKPVKPAKIEQNGVSRPAAGTTTARVWEIADAMSTAAGVAVERKPVLNAAVAESINIATAATQYGKWRVFNGLGKPVKVAAPAAAKAAAATVE